MESGYPPPVLGHYGAFAHPPALAMDEKDPTTAGNLVFAGIPDGFDENEETQKEEKEEKAIKKQ